jgi:hypothetical protein
VFPSAKWFYSLAIALSFTLGSAIYAQTPTKSNPPTTAPSEGTRIGTIIKDAIDVALPNVSKLIEAIFGTSKTAKKDDATTAVKDQVASATQASNAKLKEISSIAIELNVVSEYLEQSVPASQKISRLLTRLDDAPAGSMPTTVKDDWDDINKNLQKLSDIKISDINTVQPGLRLTLLQIRDIYEANQSDVQHSITNKDKTTLKSQLWSMSSLLNSVVSIAGIEITDLQQGLSALAAKGSGVTPMGVPSTARVNLFKDQSADDISAAKIGLPKVPK